METRAAVAMWLRAREATLQSAWVHLVQEGMARPWEPVDQELCQRASADLFSSLIRSAETSTEVGTASIDDEVIEQWLSRGLKAHRLVSLPVQMILELQHEAGLRESPAESRVLGQMSCLLANSVALTMASVERVMASDAARQAHKSDEVNRQLENLARARSDFVSIAAHELKTPLTLVRGYTDILREERGNMDPASMSVVDGIARGVERLSRVVEDMIDVSRIEAELLDLQVEDVSLASLVKLIVAEVASWVSLRNQTLSILKLKELPLIQADSRRLHLAFLNIVTNSIKFTPDGGRIAIAGRLLGTQGQVGIDFVELIIADTGIGIAREEQTRIFEQFYRVGDIRYHSSGDYKFKGAGPGLGLPIARGIIEAHGGRVWAQSEGYDEVRCPGSQFHIVLPVTQPSLHKRGHLARKDQTAVDAL
jgi:signal transduction histidine kinase